jgi:hypothetical protein
MVNTYNNLFLPPSGPTPTSQSTPVPIGLIYEPSTSFPTLLLMAQPLPLYSMSPFTFGVNCVEIFRLGILINLIQYNSQGLAVLSCGSTNFSIRQNPTKAELQIIHGTSEPAAVLLRTFGAFQFHIDRPNNTLTCTFLFVSAVSLFRFRHLKFQFQSYH